MMMGWWPWSHDGGDNCSEVDQLKKKTGLQWGVMTVTTLFAIIWIKGSLLTCLLPLEIAALPLSVINYKSMHYKEIKIRRTFMQAPNSILSDSEC